MGLWIAAIPSVVLGCNTPPSSGDDEVGTSETSDTETDTGDSGTDTDTTETGDPEAPFELAWDEVAFELALVHGDEVLLRFPADGFLLGEVDMIDDASSYDPMFVDPLAWRTIVAAETIEDTPTRVEANLEYEGGATAHLLVEEQAPGRFAGQWTPQSATPPIGLLRLAPIVDPQEGFYGLGEYFDQPEHRSMVRALQLEFDAQLDSSTNEAHVPVPYLIGTNGWGLYVVDDHAARFDVATEADDRVLATFGTGPDSGAGLSFHLFGAEHPLDLTAHYYAVSGLPHRPAPWALGPWIWRDENMDQAEVEADIQTLRDLDLATSAIWVDRPYASGVNTFDFEAARFPDPQAMIDQAHAAGLRFALWHTPYLDPDDPTVATLRAEADMLGLFPPDTGLLTSSWGEPLDLTNPEAFAWWQAHLQSYADMGIEGYKLDYAEDVTVGINGIRTVWEFADGSSERTMHKGYPRFYHQLYQEMLPPTGGFLLARAGTHGDQLNVDVIWPGDLDATMSRHGEMVTDYVSVGGLPAAVVAGLSLGPSGFPLFASDTGGYRHSPPTPETFVRWFEHTALMPVMQIGTSSNDVAWEFDAQVLDWYRELTRLHLRLFPYVWTHVIALESTGRPIVRPLGLAYPELGEHPHFDYMLGDALLVAPVVDPGATTREITFPEGQWLHWFTGEEIFSTRVTADFGGPEMTFVIDAPLGTPPLFLRAGDLVPMLRETIDSLAPTSMPGTDPGQVDSLASDPGQLTIRTSAGPLHELVLFDGTVLRQYTDIDVDVYVIELFIAPGQNFVAGARFEVMGQSIAPSSVADEQGAMPMLDASEFATAERGWTHDPATLGGLLQIAVGPGEHTVVVEL